MTDPRSLSRRPLRRFWGWGLEADVLLPMEKSILKASAALLGRTASDEPKPPRLEDFELPKPRLAPPAALADQFSALPHDRLCHAYGKSYADAVRMWMRHVPAPPDWVAFPESESDIAAILDWASSRRVAVVPYGGGSSVVAGVETDVGGDYAAVVSLDLERLDRVLEIDEVSRAGRFQAGIYGPDLEAAIKPKGLTLRHFPQSFQFSTLGGWIVTRSGGHYASLYTHIDDFVQSLRLVTPKGVIETRRLPGSGAGPQPERLVLGSEGVLGIVTEAWMRLQARPKFRASASVRFADAMAGA
ncbi:MAG: FAD-binding oxidoreductase, partial [Alphaproteobacteria bacterium]|nr:FAD-binding oxidoreductase [Alphaproteobacteria bacterium]